MAPTPGVTNTCGGGGAGEFGVCGDAATLIHAIQGSGPASPLAGNTAIVEATVVGVFRDAGEIGGYFLQEEDAQADADPATSEGLYIFDNAHTPVMGSKVRVQGTVAEFNGLTELNGVTNYADCGAGGAATAANVALPLASLSDFESREGMAVSFQQTLFISEYFNYDRFGEIVLSSERRFQPTAIADPVAPNPIAAANLLDRITLDDGRNTQNPDPALHPNGAGFDLNNLFRGGDALDNVTGVMHFAFDLYRIQPTEPADYTNTNPRTAEPDDVGGRLKISSFNVLNYFTTIDTGAFICGPSGGLECRGADDANELTRQRDKIVAAMAAIDADVFGLIEIENNAGDGPTADLVDELNDEVGAGTYSYVATGAIGTDAIRVAFLYKPGTVTPLGDFAVLNTSVDPRFIDTRNRPALAQTFQENATGQIFTVVVNHLKSKGSDCLPDDPDLGDGAGNCNVTRREAAEALVDWLATDPTGSGDADYLIMGDLNSYTREDPIDSILEGADDIMGTADDYTNLVALFEGPDAYSYVFDGQLGYLDHALAIQSLTAQVSGVTTWHINSDEPDLIDYDTTFKLPAQDAIYAPDPYRSSDHDPVILGLSLNAELPDTDGDGVPDFEDDCDFAPNPGQQDSDGDGKGNACDADGLIPNDCSGMEFDAVFVGTTGNDTLTGTPYRDLVLAKSGNDTVSTGDGDDCIDANNGNDNVDGGDGDDVVIGNAGNDVINAGVGANKVLAGNGNDTVRSGSDSDSIEAADGDDVIESGGGGDTIDAGNGNDIVCTGTFGSFGEIGTCSGGAETDSVQLRDGNDRVQAGDGGTLVSPQVVSGGNGNDEIRTGSGVDHIDAGSGNDIVNAGDGGDSIIGGNGNDQIDCGAAVDSANSGAGSDQNVAGRCEIFS
jgi:predicted extracellular nuclease